LNCKDFILTQIKSIKTFTVKNLISLIEKELITLYNNPSRSQKYFLKNKRKEKWSAIALHAKVSEFPCLHFFMNIKEITLPLRKAFVKECDFSLPVLSDPYFAYFVNLFNEYDNTLISRLKCFMDCVNQFGGEQNYFTELKRLKESVIEHIKSKTQYICLNENDFPAYMMKFLSEYRLCTNELFCKEKCGKEYISLDITKANFESFKYMSPQIVDNYDTYELFISQFFKHDHLINSRNIRQYIFGNLSPKRQNTILQYITKRMYKDIVANIPKAKLSTHSQDELVFEKDDNISSELIREALKLCTVSFKLTEFTLDRIGDHPFYIKKMNDGTFQLKCIPDYFLAQVYKKAMNKSIEELDLVFMFDCQLSKFITPLF